MNCIWNKNNNETMFEWKLRLCKAKINKECDLDWQEIVDLLGLEVSADHLRKTAYGLIEYDNYIHNLNGVSNRILSISDLHIPFNLSLETFKDYNGKVDTLVLNGDIQDCQSVSKYPKKYRINFSDEMVIARQFMIDLINMINPKKVVIVKGNHEYRLSRYLSEKLNEDLMSIMPDSPMDLIVNEGFRNKDRINKTETYYSPLVEVFSDNNIEISYNGEWHRKVGKTIFAHPLSYSSGMLKTTEKAIEYFLRTEKDFDCVVLGHTHKLGFYSQGNIKMYEQGCCCNLDKLDYNDGFLTIPNKNGFIYICQNENGEIISEKTKLIEINP